MTQTYTLVINGEARQVQATADTPLIYILRNQLGLKGTRYGCGLEQCGCCTILIDGEPAYACTRAVDSAEGREIRTVEGLSGVGSDAGSVDHPLQQAFLAEQAGQCGYCLSGVLMSAKALLDQNPSPSRAEIVTALDGHLCRCGSHTRIIRAVERAAAALSQEQTS
ncbi:MAG: (2Fe-2S)-binding protein [Rhodospirillaceae bacterium]|jgi:nicotinate dehydrogenase subunit A|nr:(2Fe-2S)-binding protein [Rhodospirillaceae bacterium]